MDQSPLTREEMIELFGEAMPMEAVALMWEAPADMTLAEVRGKLREIAVKSKQPITLTERLRADASSWAGATHTVAGPSTAALEREAADEIKRLQQRLMEVECMLNAASDGKYLPDPPRN